jgi:hypothetical protein
MTVTFKVVRGVRGSRLMSKGFESEFLSTAP